MPLSRRTGYEALQSHVNYDVPIVLPGMAGMEHEDYDFGNRPAAKTDFIDCRQIDNFVVSAIAIDKGRFEGGYHLRPWRRSFL